MMQQRVKAPQFLPPRGIGEPIRVPPDAVRRLEAFLEALGESPRRRGELIGALIREALPIPEEGGAEEVAGG